MRNIVSITVFVVSLLVSSLGFAQARYSPYEVKPPEGFWTIKGGAGMSMRQPFFNNTPVLNPSTVNPAETVQSAMTQTSQNFNPLYSVSLQKSFVLDKTAFYAFSIGISLYYQNINSAGTGNIPANPVIGNTFSYTFNQQQILPFLELQWTPIFLWHHVSPYFILGGGVNISTNTFNVTDLQIGPPQPNSANTQQTNFAAEAGAGLEILFTQSFGIDLRYAYLKNSNATLTDIALNPVSYNNDSQNILLSLIYRFGYS